MPYYDKISKQWHSVTGFHGGAFKSLVLNEILLDKKRPAYWINFYVEERNRIIRYLTHSAAVIDFTRSFIASSESLTKRR
jgi:hypothetical protein